MYNHHNSRFLQQNKIIKIQLIWIENTLHINKYFSPLFFFCLKIIMSNIINKTTTNIVITASTMVATFEAVVTGSQS